MADPASPVGAATPAAKPPPRRRTRLPRWTRREILVLVQGKREADCRGMQRSWSACGETESKWEAIASFCGRRGVDRGAAQCQKRWSNLVAHFRRIREWESYRGGAGAEAEEGRGEEYWLMRGEEKRERKLPAHFDRVVYDVLDGKKELREGEEEEEAVFDSGRRGESGLFSDDEDEEVEVEEEVEAAAEPVDAVPISERRSDSDPIVPFMFGGGAHFAANQQSPAEKPDAETAAPGNSKKRRMSSEEDSVHNLQNQLTDIFSRNHQILAAHLEAHVAERQQEKDLRRDQSNSMMQVLNKIAEALTKIAEKM